MTWVHCPPGFSFGRFLCCLRCVQTQELSLQVLEGVCCNCLFFPVHVSAFSEFPSTCCSFTSFLPGSLYHSPHEWFRVQFKRQNLLSLPVSLTLFLSLTPAWFAFFSHMQFGFHGLLPFPLAPLCLKLQAYKMFSMGDLLTGLAAN